MDWYDVLDQIVDLLEQRRRLTYRLLKRQFALDDETLEDLKDELIYAQQVARDEDGKVMVWLEDAEAKTEPVQTPSVQPEVSSESERVEVETPPAETPASDTAERRQLTVMFVDLVGSTRLSGELDPEDLRDIVREYQRACTEVVTTYEGHVAQLLGDGLLVYFGYPQAHEDDAQRAVRSGLGILEAISDLNTQLEHGKVVNLSVRLGIHTGLVVVGDMGGEGRQEQLALGETPNVAARIQGLAEPDTLIISDVTYRLVEGFFDCDALGGHDLKGVTEPVPVYRVLNSSGAQHRLDMTGTRGLTSLVGRHSECQLLIDRWNQAKSGEGQVVLLNAEPGLGKSRMVQALKEHLADEAYMHLECRSSPYFTNSALYPVIDMIQRTLRFQSDETPEQKLEKLEQNLSSYRLPLEETISLFGTLLSLSVPEDRYPPLNWTPQRQRQKTLESIVSIILELAERQPVLFILEDGHWQDPSTNELLNLLIDQTSTASLLILVTFRPEFQPMWGNRSYLTQMTLNRLSRSEVESIATEVSGGKGLPDEIIAQLVDRTDGVPLYVEEMTKAVLESGVLKEMDEHYELTSPIGALTIPATLQDSLMARLDRLVTAKGVAQYASVIGRQFSYALLRDVSQLDEVTLQRELGRLVEAEVVYQQGVIPQATYTFKHALVRDAAYQSLLRNTRQGYHRRIAETLEERFPDTAATRPELLAHHYTEARLIEQSVLSWYQAGQKATQRAAYIEAVTHLNSGLEVLAELPDTPTRAEYELDLQVALGLALMLSKGYGSPEVGHAYARARSLCEQLDAAPRLINVLAGLRRFYSNNGDIQAARELAEQELALAQSTQDPILLLEGHYSLGIALLQQGDLASAQDHLEQGASLGASLGDTPFIFYELTGMDVSLSCRSIASCCVWLCGYPEQAFVHAQETTQLAHQRPHPYILVLTLDWTGLVPQFRRQVRTVQEQAKALMELARDHGYELHEARGMMWHGWALASQEQGHEGIGQICQGLAISESGGELANRPYYLGLLAEAYGMTGQTEIGITELNRAFEIVGKNGTHWYEAGLYRLQGDLLLQQSSDNAAKAESCFRQAITIAQNQSAKSLELRAATSLSRLWQSQGQCQDAYDLLAPVYEWFTEGFDTADLVDAKGLLSELEGRRS